MDVGVGGLLGGGGEGEGAIAFAGDKSASGVCDAVEDGETLLHVGPGVGEVEVGGVDDDGVVF